METIKITLLDVVNAKQAASDIERIKPSNPKIAYRLGKALRQIKIEANEFDEQRKKLIADAGMPESSPELAEFMKTAEYKELEAKVEALLGEEVELRVAAIPYAWIENEGESSFAVSVFDAFWFMFEDENNGGDNEDGPSE